MGDKFHGISCQSQFGGPRRIFPDGNFSYSYSKHLVLPLYATIWAEPQTHNCAQDKSMTLAWWHMHMYLGDGDRRISSSSLASVTWDLFFKINKVTNVYIQGAKWSWSDIKLIFQWWFSDQTEYLCSFFPFENIASTGYNSTFCNPKTGQWGRGTAMSSRLAWATQRVQCYIARPCI